jgi:ZIP family zinc transporter
MSLGAGMATGVGASLVMCTRTLDRGLLAYTLAFSAGVMSYVSLVEVVGVSTEYFEHGYASHVAYALGTASFFAGVTIMAIVDRVVHTVFDAIAAGHGHAHGHAHGHGHGHVASSASGAPGPGSRGGGEEEAGMLHEETPPSDLFEDEGGASIRAVAHIEERRRLLMMASVVSSAIVLHNIPEGMATYVASFHSISAGAPLAVAIAIHNIPEGLAVAVPIAYATKNNARAVGLGALSGLSEPFGALLASLVANENSSTGVFGAMFGLTGGMMMYVWIAELLPAAYSERGVPREAVTAAFFGGCLVMAASLVIEKYAAAT